MALRGMRRRAKVTDWSESEIARRLDARAELSVARACAFAGLATLCLMIGLSAEPAACLRAGGYAILLTAVLLLLKAQRARSKPYRQTEVWLMLDPHERPHEGAAQRMIGTAMRQQLHRFAAYHAIAAAALLVLSLLAELVTRA